MPELTILSPHLDDAALSCWRQVEQPDSQVVTIFAGVPEDAEPSWWDRACGESSAIEAMLRRRAENAVALSGITRVVNLYYLDDLYRSTSPPTEEITETVLKLHRVGGDLLAASGIGNHPDHRKTLKVGRSLLEDGHSVTFYADIPYTLPKLRLKNWAHKASEETIKQQMDMDIELEVHELTTEEQERKKQAVRAYSSQFNLVNLTHLGALSRMEAYRWEILIHPV